MGPQDFDELADGVMKTAVGVFGKWVTYYPKAGASYRIQGVFDRMYEAVDPDTERVVSSNQPNIGFRVADMPAVPVKGDQVLIGTTKYRVIDSQEDGIAGVKCFLHEVK